MFVRDIWHSFVFTKFKGDVVGPKLRSRDLDLVNTPRTRLHHKDRDSRLKIRDRDLIICRLCQNISENILKTIISASKLKLFRIFGNFSTCFYYFISADTTDNKHVELKNFSKPYRCNIQSLETMGWDRDLWLLRHRRDLKLSRPRLAKMGLDTSSETPSLKFQARLGGWFLWFLLVLYIHFCTFPHIVFGFHISSTCWGDRRITGKYRSCEAPRSTRKVFVVTHRKFWRTNNALATAAIGHRHTRALNSGGIMRICKKHQTFFSVE